MIKGGTNDVVSKDGSHALSIVGICREVRSKLITYEIFQKSPLQYSEQTMRHATNHADDVFWL